MNPKSVYWVVLLAAFFAVAVWESVRPAVPTRLSAARRWTLHGLLMLAASVAAAAVVRVTPMSAAVLAGQSGWGLLTGLNLPLAATLVPTILLLDAVRYTAHRMMHGVAFLWRVHEIHHSDPDFDVTTAARFHPLDAVVTQGAAVLAVIALGLPFAAVFAAEILSLAVNLFSHANATLPPAFDRVLRKLIVTPVMHRTHHSLEIAHQGTNFGQTFSWWDRMCGTYSEDEAERTGVEEVADAESVSAGYLLAGPFRGRANPPARSTSARTGD